MACSHKQCLRALIHSLRCEDDRQQSLWILSARHSCVAVVRTSLIFPYKQPQAAARLRPENTFLSERNNNKTDTVIVRSQKPPSTTLRAGRQAGSPSRQQRLLHSNPRRALEQTKTTSLSGALIAAAFPIPPLNACCTEGKGRGCADVQIVTSSTPPISVVANFHEEACQQRCIPPRLVRLQNRIGESLSVQNGGVHASWLASVVI